MGDFVHYFNISLGIGTIVLQIISVFTLFLLFFVSKENRYLSFIKKNFIILAFFLLFFSVLFSLFYSEILNYAPCFHCWIQRIFLFPQMFLFGIAWFRKDKNVFWYSIFLLLVGMLDALYLNYIYYFNPNSAPCDASGVSCVKRLVSEFGGYISIPMFSFTIFFVLMTVLLVVYFYKKDESINI
ncbi:hypothetical protein CO033_02535 [Candidatus Nomurabacteria bacterium CG_4_9_14_0_2_um_filter_32_10]|uniref:Disulfide bond formation protein B n=3 Tax=Candidatus Nomuraibacteriota TaxID=1752729 RepID=A0A2H0CIJ0_9BACT|nr:MAG: hypothetical protein COW91_00785 [Candidatus Nomurabacteria bacterium CG22_combo_CG10-13_8_21_14_all_32_8]PIZ86273.1 MAG: hypothetical protein COX94_00670 [Candidatus Nomurabacteria bacterium CG_4_10_14_0_2_um_filter_33_9]PJC49250.1 MAG: hypothetical protein CO033_02535 [Candidatus Nomurabacteria bacterium CG_4_9_14_0_2_um_filter_32_10]